MADGTLKRWDAGLGEWVYVGQPGDLKDYTDAEVATAVPRDLSAFADPLRVERSGKDAEGVFTVVEWFRVGGELAVRSTLSGGTSPEYTTRTVEEFALDGDTVDRTTVYTLAYDADGDLTTETTA